MIKKFIDKLLGKKPAAALNAKKPKFGKREEIGVDVHGIDPKLVDDRAVFVVRTLKDAGFEAYIVGGAVRDLTKGRLQMQGFERPASTCLDRDRSSVRRTDRCGGHVYQIRRIGQRTNSASRHDRCA